MKLKALSEDRGKRQRHQHRRENSRVERTTQVLSEGARRGTEGETRTKQPQTSPDERLVLPGTKLDR